jgi:putative ABC transport system permease protein
MPLWLFYRFIVRRFARNPIRGGLLITSVAVATTLVSSVMRVSLSSVETFEESLGYSAKEYSLQIVPVGGRMNLDESRGCLSRLESRFDLAAYRREAAQVETAHGLRAVRLTGIAGIGGGNTSLSGDEVYASSSVLQEMGMSPGEAVRIHGHDFDLEMRVARSDDESRMSMNSMLVPLGALAGSSGNVADGILLRPKRADSLSEQRKELAEWLSTCATFSTPFRVDSAQSAVERSERLLAAYRFNVGIMAAMTVLVCVLLVTQATNVSLQNISRELSILRTLGISRSGCVSAILNESLIIGVSGSVLGMTIGTPGALALTKLFLSTAHDIYNVDLATGALSVWHDLGVVMFMTFVVMAGASVGAVGALRISPSIGTRTGGSSVQPIPLRFAVLVGAVSVCIASVVTIALIAVPSLVLAYLYIGACVVFAAGLTPLFLAGVPSLLGGRRGSLPLWIGRGGVRTGARGYLLGAIGATLAVSLICALSLMVGSFRATLHDWSGIRLRGDLFVSTSLDGKENESRLSPKLVSSLRAVDGVAAILPYYETRTTVDGRELVVGASDLTTQVERGIFIVREGRLNAALMGAGQEALLSEGGARKLGLRVGDRLAIEGRLFTIGAIVQEFGTELPLAQIDERAFGELYPAHYPQNITIDLRRGNSIEDARRKVERIVGVAGIVRDNSELRGLVLTLFDRTFQVTNSIRWIVFGLGVVGLLLASLQHLWERRRELKTLYLVGMRPVDMVMAFVYESVLVTVLPVLLGVVGGVAMGWGLTQYINPLSFGWSITFAFSWYPILISALFVASVALIVGIATALLLRRAVAMATFSDE